MHCFIQASSLLPSLHHQPDVFDNKNFLAYIRDCLLTPTFGMIKWFDHSGSSDDVHVYFCWKEKISAFSVQLFVSDVPIGLVEP